MPHKALELDAVAVCSSEALSQGRRDQAMFLLWAAKPRLHIGCRAVSDLWIRLLECCKGAPAEAQEAQKGPAGAAGQLLVVMCCVIRKCVARCGALCAGLL